VEVRKGKMIVFTAEKTLGKLVKWLRLLGFDTIYEREDRMAAHDHQGEDDRIFLTRSRHVDKEKGIKKAIFIHSNDPFDQIREVIQALRMDRNHIRPFSRCARCNHLTETLEKESVRGLVPDFTWENQAAFRTCPKCHRIFWKGSHFNRMMDRIDRLFHKNGVEAIWRTK